MLLVLFTKVFHTLAKPFLAANSLASSTIKKCCTPCFWCEKSQLLSVSIIGLVKHNFLENLCVVVMGTSVWTIFCPWFMLWQTGHFVDIPYLSRGWWWWSGGSVMGVCRTFRCWSPVLIYLIWIGRVVIWINISVDCKLPCISVARLRVLFFGIQGLLWLFQVVSSSSVKISSWFRPTTSL